MTAKLPVQKCGVVDTDPANGTIIRATAVPCPPTAKSKHRRGWSSSGWSALPPNV